MNRITIDGELASKLADAPQAVEICDPAGRCLGLFKSNAYWRQYEHALATCPMTDDELRRRSSETRSGRTLDEILRDLRKRAS